MVVVESRKMARLKGFYPIMGIQNCVRFFFSGRKMPIWYSFSICWGIVLDFYVPQNKFRAGDLLVTTYNSP